MLKLRASVVFAAVAGLTAGMVGASLAAAPARAEECPGNPNALGTSRVLVLEAGEFTRVGVMQYPDSLPLRDKEVVLTFDDGPLPPYSNQILDILASQCVKVTYFLVGEMAHSFPATVRRMYEAGHSIGTHSEDHPSRFDRISLEKVRQEIDRGIADVGAALGDPRELAPFFRIPGLGRTNAVEQELAARSLVVFSSDTVADDWHRHIKPGEIVSRAMSRLERRGKGILLLHDIHPATVAALPGLLKELKEKGFHVVHVVPGEQPGQIETAGNREPSTTGSIAPSGRQNDPSWPKVTVDAMADRIALPAPDATLVMLADGEDGGGMVTVSSAVPQWPEQSGSMPSADEAELPAPSMQDIGPLLDEGQAVSVTPVLRSSLTATGSDETGTTVHGLLPHAKVRPHLPSSRSTEHRKVHSAEAGQTSPMLNWIASSFRLSASSTSSAQTH